MEKAVKASLIVRWAEMIKLEHTVFALPFAVSGLLLAKTTLPSWTVVFWAVLAFVGARSSAMTLNRLIDAQIDALNPRTSTRAIPKGEIKKGHAWLFAILSFALMIYAAAQLPLICLQLSPIAVFWLSFYSYTKRITWLCHICLGIALGGAALGGWLAAGGALATPAPWLFALSVTTWVSGFDIIYASQDIEFDRQHKLQSIPAHFGITKALHISTFLHVLTVICLALLGYLLSLNFIYWLGVAIVTMALIYEHSLVKPGDLSKVNAAFFEVNGFVSILYFVCVLLCRIV